MDAARVKQRLVEALRRFDVLMVTTTDAGGAPRARPMAVAEVEDTGDVWLIGQQAAPDEPGEPISPVPAAIVTGQDAAHQLCMHGHLDVIHDPARIAALWRPSFAGWLPDVDLEHHAILLRLRPVLGELWETGAPKGIRAMFDAARAFLDGTSPPDEAIDHGRMAF